MSPTHDQMDTVRQRQRLSVDLNDASHCTLFDWEEQMNQLDDMPIESKLLTIDQIASFLQCSQRSVYRLSESGVIPPPMKLGRLARWDPRIIDDWLDAGCPAAKA